jgi:hypothetical protein
VRARVAFESGEHEWVGINDIVDTETLAHLSRRDTTERPRGRTSTREPAR